MTIFQCYYLSPVDNHFNLLLKDFFLEFHITNINNFQPENTANNMFCNKQLFDSEKQEIFPS